MSVPGLSVIVPNYRHAAQLPGCVEALRSQLAEDWELLLIDDGSDDDSVAVMEGLARGDARIRVLRNDRNRGVVWTMNRGLAEARGAFVYFAAADDRVLPGLLGRSMALLAAHPQAGLSCCASRWRDAATGVEWVMGGGMSERGGYLSPDDLVWLEQAGRLMIVSHGAVLRADVVREMGGFREDLRWHCDWWVTYGAAFRYGLVYLPEVLSEVHLHGASYYGSGSRKEEHAAVMTALLELLKEEPYQDVAVRVRDSGALGLHALPILRAIRRDPGAMAFRTPRLVRKCWWRQAQILARRYFPGWLAGWCVRVFLGRGGG
jgi:glycosyltransferase involved in cell wall biosynthesis